MKRVRRYAVNSPSAKARKFANEQQFICPLCGGDLRDGRSVNVDHILPKSLGGSNARKNLQATHEVCNTRKADRLLGPVHRSAVDPAKTQAEHDLNALKKE